MDDQSGASNKQALEPEKEKPKTPRSQTAAAVQSISETQESSQVLSPTQRIQMIPIYDVNSASNTPVSYQILTPSLQGERNSEEPPKKMHATEQFKAPTELEKADRRYQTFPPEQAASPNVNPDGSRRERVRGKTNIIFR